MGSSTWNFTEGEEIVPGRLAVRRLGGGIRFEAYLVWDETLFSPAVVKILRPDFVTDARALRALVREAEHGARLGHPSLVRCFDLVSDGDRPHLVLEFLDGPRLSTLLRRYGPLPLEQSLPLTLELCSVAHYMAAKDIVHLDIKPSNIVMGSPPRLIDLSIARTTEQAARLDEPVGTDAYMAPEQCTPGRPAPIGAPADVWGVGATLYEAVSGSAPFPRGSGGADAPAEQAWPQLGVRPAPLHKSVPPAFATAILSCLEPDPAARPTAAELAGLIEPMLATLPRPVLAGFLPKGRRRAPDHPRPSAGVRR
ncbi:MAG: serine/threonine-protein kinase [Sporichthyaceae bacterium]